MREDSKSYDSVSWASYGAPNYLHFHDGGTCHGAPSLEICQQKAISNGWIGKVLEREDTYRDGTVAKCYSLIAGSFDHYAKQGEYVAEVKLVAVSLKQNLNPEPERSLK